MSPDPSTDYEAILAKITARVAELTPPGVELREDSNLVTELRLDSFKVLDLLLDIEDEFDISMPVNLLADVRTVEDLARKVHDTVQAAA